MPATRKTSTNTAKRTRVSYPIQKRKNRVIDKHLKEIIIEKFFDDDLSKAQVAKLFKLNWSTVDGIVERYVERGTLENLPRGGRKEKLVKLREEHSKFLNDLLDEDCQLTLGIMKERLLEKFPDLVEKGISIPQIHRHVRQEIGFTLKRTKPVEEKRNSPEVIKSRAYFVSKLQDLGISYKTNCIFVDEAGFNSNLIRGKGYSKRGENAIVKTKTKRALNITILAAISYQGVEDVTAKMVKGGTNSELFLVFIKQIVASLDRSNAASHYFIMDNARIHTAELIKKYFRSETRHHVHFLPAYSPFLNPIEECFSKLKGLVRRKPGLDAKELVNYIGESSKQIFSDNCQGWVNHSIPFFR
jgi:transposase